MLAKVWRDHSEAKRTRKSVCHPEGMVMGDEVTR